MSLGDDLTSIATSQGELLPDRIELLSSATSRNAIGEEVAGSLSVVRTLDGRIAPPRSTRDNQAIPATDREWTLTFAKGADLSGASFARKVGGSVVLKLLANNVESSLRTVTRVAAQSTSVR